MIRIRLTRYNLFFTALVLMVVPEIFFRAGYLKTSEKQIENEIRRYLDKKFTVARTTLKKVLSSPDNPPNVGNVNPFYLLYDNQRLKWWSGNHTPYVKLNELNRHPGKLEFNDFGNGYYVTLSQKQGQYTAVALVRLFRKYKFSNSYLEQKFSNSLKIPEGIRIKGLGEKKEKGDKVFSYHGQKLFYIVSNESGQTIEISGIIFALQLLGIFLLFLSCVNFGFLLAHRSPYFATCLIVLLLFALKLSLSVFSPLSLIKQADSFNPEIFASNAMDPSLGDFLLSFLAIFCCGLYFYRVYFLFLQGNKKRFFFYVTLSCLLMIGCEYYLLSGLKNLVLNSKIDFFFKNINSLNTYTIIGVCALGFGLFTQLFLLSRLRYFYHQYPPMIRLHAVLHFVFIAVMHWYWDSQYIAHFIVFSLLLLVYIAWPNRIALSPFNSTSVVLILFSIIAATIFYGSTKEKEHNDRRLLAEKLAHTEDPNVEIEFNGFVGKLSADRFFYASTQLGLQNTYENVNNYLDKKYFDAILKDYDLNYLLFLDDSTSVYPEHYTSRDFVRNAKTIALHGKKTASKNLYFIYNKQDQLDYLAFVPLTQVSDEARLIVEFRSKNIPDRAGFQELMTHNNQFYTKLLSEYSYIRFVNNKVVDQRGDFLYKISASEYDQYKAKVQFYSDQEYEHLLFRPTADSFVIISRPLTGWLTHVTSFSYILILFAFEFALISLFLYNKKIKNSFFNLSAKIQLAFIVLTILAMTLFGLTTQYAISNEYSVKNFNLLAEKLQSVKTEINQRLGGSSGITPADKKYLHVQLERLSRVFFTDIHFYNEKGILVESSADKLFRYKILSPLMNAKAYNELIVEGSPRFVQEESIGNLEYLSGYLPYYNDNKKLLGYINIPLFAQQNTASNEFSSLLMAIINIFVVLFAFTILISVIVTQIIISPLRNIRENIAKMQLNKVNKPIVYKGKDELADLVKEYNNKVAELEKYAFYLAQSERESAWREMAKQVAHEIKNPLTPMKLNIQHMQRSLKKDDPDFENKLAKISQSLVEQIDTLTNIASEFSNLAKMPGSKFERIDYRHLVEGVIELYADDEHTQVKLQNNAGEVFVNADKEQLLRVLNNLVKNAQQAIPEERKGEIAIRLEKQEGKVYTYVIDNGAGISDGQKEKIFQPNFTTKSTGSGLGLTMVKNIVEQHKGTIYFETNAGLGTTFIFTLPSTD
ncbi:MAG TPA: HAMP domain-containing sensor histidine kinase [Flavobacteriales bacterium]|nr:HAMP domain-containing sensor histidine kinase [Flavobacteriales bacterium]